MTTSVQEATQSRPLESRQHLQALTTTVPRQYVHRAAVSEVLLTGWRSTVRDDTFVVGAQWPRGHSVYAQSGGYQDSMLLIESVRQVGSLLAHAEFGVPFGHQFLMRHITINTGAELLVATAAPTEVELRVNCRDITRRGDELTGMHYDVAVFVGETQMATGSASFTCIRPNTYRRLRGDRLTRSELLPPAPAEPALVGRRGTEHVVLAESAAGTPGRWEIRVDSNHPNFFDHPVDHIPGMLLIEAARQASLRATGLPHALVLGIESSFERYAEFDAPCFVVATPGLPDALGNVLVQIRGTQRDQTVFSADLCLKPRQQRGTLDGR